MPRPKTDAFWLQRISTLAEQGLKAQRIHRELERIAEELDRDDYPSLSVVERQLKDWRAKPENLRRQYAYVRWPDSMGDDGLPWDASRTVLDLLRYHDARELERPTVSEARWYWRLRLAAPTMPDDDAVHFACMLAAREFTELIAPRASVTLPDLEWRLAFEPWRDEAHLAAYGEAAQRHDLSHYPSSVAVGSFADNQALHGYWRHRFGPEAAEALVEAELKKVSEALGEH